MTVGQPKTGKRKRLKKMPPGIRYREHKDADGLVDIRFYGRIKQCNGKWSEVRLQNCITPDEAYNLLKKLRKGKARTVRQTRALTVDGLVEMTNRNKKFKLSDNHLRKIELHVRPYFSDQSLASADLYNFKSWLEKRDNSRGGFLSAQSVRSVLMVKGRLMKAGGLEYDIPHVTVNNQRKYEITNDHLQAMLNATKN